MRNPLNVTLHDPESAWGWLEQMADAGLLFHPESGAAGLRPAKGKPLSVEEMQAAESLMQSASFHLDGQLDSLVELHTRRLALVRRFGKRPKLAVIEDPASFKPVLAFFHPGSGLWIANPNESPGGEPVESSLFYGLDGGLACALLAANGHFDGF